MKIQLDTLNKTITIEEDVNLHDFYEQINAILPDGKWREFTLKVGKIVEWKEPLHLPKRNPYEPLTTPQPNTYPNIWYGTTTGDSDEGIFNFNFEVKA